MSKTKQVLFIQGGGEGTHDAWDDKLVASLRRELGPGYEVRYPHMPDESEPHYASWKRAIDEELEQLGDGAVVVGHSIGGTILVHALAEKAPVRSIAGIFLVAAPFVGEGGWPGDEFESPGELATLPEAVPVFLYHGENDETAPVDHVRLYAKAVPRGVVRVLKKRDHQLGDDLSEVAADIRALG